MPEGSSRMIGKGGLHSVQEIEKKVPCKGKARNDYLRPSAVG